MSDFSPKQQRAIELFAQGKSVNAVSRELGVSTTTIMKWQIYPEFKTAIRQSVRSTCRRIADLTVDAGIQAIEYLQNVLFDDEASITEKIRAATTILNNVSTWKQLDTEERLEALEAVIAANNGQVPDIEK